MESYILIDRKNKQNIDFPCVPFCIERAEITPPDPIHLHEFHQLTILLKGHGEITVNGLKHKIHAGNVYVISNYSPHNLRDFKNLEVVNILFHIDDLLKYAGNLKHEDGFQRLFLLPSSSADASTLFGHILTLDFKGMQYVNDILSIMLSEIQEKRPGCEVLIQSYFMILVTFFSRQYEQTDFSHSPENELYQIVSYISQNYNRSIRSADLVRVSNLNEHKIREIFSREFHCSPVQYLIAIRLKHACYLLNHTDLSVAEIADQVGFEDSNYFSRIFKKHYSVSPSDYRLGEL